MRDAITILREWQAALSKSAGWWATSPSSRDWYAAEAARVGRVIERGDSVAMAAMLEGHARIHDSFALFYEYDFVSDLCREERVAKAAECRAAAAAMERRDAA
jgi:hypothetical protein